jgi:hypothetical protein
MFFLLGALSRQFHNFPLNKRCEGGCFLLSPLLALYKPLIHPFYKRIFMETLGKFPPELFLFYGREIIEHF